MFNVGVNRFRPVHPLGNELPWSSEDADLSKAVVVNLAASGKTARAWSDIVCGSRGDSMAGPLGVLNVTSDPSKLITKFPKKKTINYTEITTPETFDWIKSLRVERIVIMDFGGRDSAAGKLHTALLGDDWSKEQILFVQIGQEAKVYSEDEMNESMKAFGELGKVQLNTSGVKDRALERRGAKFYYSDMMKGWEKWIESGGLEGMRLDLGNGIGGSDGIEGGWSNICKGNVDGDVGMAYMV